MSLINCKVEFSLKWYNNCILSSSGTAATFTITDTKLYVPVVTLKTKANTKLSKLLSKGFKWPIYLNEYKVIPNKNYNANEHVREILGASIQGVNWFFFFFAYIGGNGNNIIEEDSYQKYFLPRLKIENYNIEIDGRNFYHQPINDSIKQYDEIQDKVMIIQLVVY